MIKQHVNDEYIETKDKKYKIIPENKKNVIIEDLGSATNIGTLDMEKFIEVAMNLPSFWR